MIDVAAMMDGETRQAQFFRPGRTRYGGSDGGFKSRPFETAARRRLG